MKGKTGIVFGVANKRSIAWGIANELLNRGAKVLIICQNERLISKVERFLGEEYSVPVMACDVQNDKEIENLFANLPEDFQQLDFMVHSLAYAPASALAGNVIDVTREDFKTTFDISVFSFINLARFARKFMKNGGAMLTMSYLGGDRVMPGYGIMGPAKAALESCVRYLASDLGPSGIRVNAISAGPVKTLASSTFGEFNKVLEAVEGMAPLRKNITSFDVGKLASFLISDDGNSITGCTYFIDAGIHIIGG